MTRKRLTLIFFTTLLVLALTPSVGEAECVVDSISRLSPTDTGVAATAPSLIDITGANAGATLIINREGITERVADILITDSGAGVNCFTSGRRIVVTYNAALTQPSTITAASTSNLDIFDSAGSGGVIFQISTTVGLGPGNQPQSVIQIDVLQAGTVGDIDATATGSGLRLSNLRVNASSLVVGAPANAIVSASGGSVASFGPFTEQVGVAQPVIDTAVPAASGTCPAGPSLCVLAGNAPGPGIGKQSSGSTLTTHALIQFAELAANPSAFRTAVTSGSVRADLATTATTLVFDVTGIPSGVTVSFPSTITVSTNAVTDIRFSAKSATLSATGGSLAVAYNTGSNVVTGSALVSVRTNASAADFVPAAGTAPAVLPSIGVSIGSTSGFGTASLRVVFGPGESSAFTGDDVGAASVPRYVAGIGAAPSRKIIGGTTGTPVSYFVINPTRTVLLYPFVTNLAGFNTGIAVANTASDSTAFSPATTTGGQNGGLTFFFFPTGGASFSFTTSSSAVGRGLSASGTLAPGAVFAAPLDGLLTAAGQAALIGTFDGYVIVVAQFDFAHGFALVFTPAGQITTSEALILGAGTRGSAVAEGLATK